MLWQGDRPELGEAQRTKVQEQAQECRRGKVQGQAACLPCCSSMGRWGLI